MGEITQSLEVLGLKAGASKEEVRHAYRELAMVWHPDRFAAGSELQAKAHEKFRDLNLAYRCLMGREWEEGAPVVEPESPEPPVAEEAQVESKPNRTALSILVAAVLVLAAGGGVWFTRLRSNASQKATETVVAEREPNLLNTLEQRGDCTVTEVPEGLLLAGQGQLMTRDKYTPPFVIDATAKTDLTNIRLYYGKGVVILNWEMNPSELRYHDPKTGAIEAVAGKGRVAAGEWVRVEWALEPNGATLTVNGEERAKFSGDYRELRETIGIGPAVGSELTIKSLRIRPRAGAH
jgi:hypothetical protein